MKSVKNMTRLELLMELRGYCTPVHYQLVQGKPIQELRALVAYGRTYYQHPEFA